MQPRRGRTDDVNLQAARRQRQGVLCQVSTCRRLLMSTILRCSHHSQRTSARASIRSSRWQWRRRPAAAAAPSGHRPKHMNMNEWRQVALQGRHSAVRLPLLCAAASSAAGCRQLHRPLPTVCWAASRALPSYTRFAAAGGRASNSPALPTALRWFAFSPLLASNASSHGAAGLQQGQPRLGAA